MITKQYVEVTIYAKTNIDQENYTEVVKYKTPVYPTYKKDDILFLNDFLNGGQDSIAEYTVQHINHSVYKKEPYNNSDLIDVLLHVYVILTSALSPSIDEEESQEMIIFKKVALESLIGPYSDSPYKSVGHIVHWIRAYGFHNYDLVQVGWNKSIDLGEVTFHKKTIATYIFDDQLQMPIFKFKIAEENDIYERCQHYQDTYLNGLKKGYTNPYIKK